VRDSIIVLTAVTIVSIMFLIGIGVMPDMTIFGDGGDRLVITIIAFVIGFYHTKHWPAKVRKNATNNLNGK